MYFSPIGKRSGTRNMGIAANSIACGAMVVSSQPSKY